jgi:cold shock CspA family protein
MSERIRGKVSNWYPGRKYGFITPHDASPEVYAHAYNIRRQSSEPDSLIEGEEVEFTLMQGDSGPYAAGIVRNPPLEST